jgi:outer membrane biosynthesis protein TonB
VTGEESGKEKGGWRRHGAALGAGATAVAVIVAGVFLFRSSGSEPTKKPPEIRMVTLQPLPPPPPPPPPPQQLPQPKMVEQTPIKDPEVKQEKPLEKPKEAPPKPEAPPTGPLGFDAKGEGPGDAFNLAGRPGGNGLLGGGGGGSRWGWYASIVQAQIEQALRENQKTRNAKLRIEVRLWSDASGRIDRVQLISSTGDIGIDETIKNEVLTGLRLREPPPKDMPMPIVARLTERQPS